MVYTQKKSVAVRSRKFAEQKGVITVVFRTESEKRQFLESVGQDPDRNAVNFEEFRRLLS